MPVLFLQEITREKDLPVAEAGSSDIPSVKGMKLPCGTVCETLLLQAFELYRFWMLEHVFSRRAHQRKMFPRARHLT